MRRQPELLLFAIILLLLSCSSVEPDPTENRAKITLYLIGDSTVATKRPDLYPETGWGQVIDKYLDTLVHVENRAVNGKSTKSFLSNWGNIVNLLHEGDYVFIEFGHNDEDTLRAEVGVTIPEYKMYLMKYINEVRAKKAIPVLLTPIARRSFSNNIYIDSHGEYPNAMRSVANKYNVPLIDMHAKSVSLLKQLGVEDSKSIYKWLNKGQYPNYPNGARDNTHFSEYGADIMAKLVIQGIKESNLNLSHYIPAK